MFRSKYDHLVCQQLEAAFSPVSESELEHGFCRAVRETRYNLDFAENMKLIHSAVQDFWSCLCSRQIARIPVVRALIKVHKAQLSARLLVANTAWVTSPLAVWLAAILQPIVDMFSTVAASSEDVVKNIEELTFSHRNQVHSFDVEQLYPSIDQHRAQATIHACLVRHFTLNPVPNWGALTELIVAIVAIVLSAQYAVYCVNGVKKHFRQSTGLSTGLACGRKLPTFSLKL